MPEMDGLELIKQLREDPEIGAMPTLIYTGTSVTDSEPVIDAGATKVFYKPIDLEAMIDYAEEFFKPVNVQ
jgi:CheY-like chemotaxis protein